MAKSVFTANYDRFRSLLVLARHSKGLTQSQLAVQLDKPQSFVSKYELGERRLDVVEFVQIAQALEINPSDIISELQQHREQASHLVPPADILTRWQINSQELTNLVDENPSLRGILLGYVAELKVAHFFSHHAYVKYCRKYDDHDRKKKGDRVITYRGNDFTIEVKSLQTNSVEKVGAKWVGKAQVDASDRREVKLPDGSKIATTCLLAGEFDLLAVNLFAFEQKWRFTFAKNDDLPRSKYMKYTKKQREALLATLVTVTWPSQPPFYDDPFPLLEEIARER